MTNGKYSLRKEHGRYIVREVRDGRQVENTWHRAWALYRYLCCPGGHIEMITRATKFDVNQIPNERRPRVRGQA